MSLAACLVILPALTAACASAPPAYTTRVKDPWESANRAIFEFNMKFDKAVARPVAKQYVRAVPRPTRNGLHNVLHNLGEPVTIISDLLQGNLRASLKDTTRFVVNSTVGVAGWFDVAQHLDLPDHNADLGEVLAHWGVPAGPYIVLPVLGPSDLRDAGAMYPAYYANPAKDNMQSGYRNADTVLNSVDTRAGLLNLDSTIDSAFDPYTFVRDAWIQHRRFELYNGNPPPLFPSYDLPDEGTSAPPAAATTTPATSNVSSSSIATPAVATEPAGKVFSKKPAATIPPH